jgi:hypothetical protein
MCTTRSCAASSGSTGRRQGFLVINTVGEDVTQDSAVDVQRD